MDGQRLPRASRTATSATGFPWRVDEQTWLYLAERANGRRVVRVVATARSATWRTPTVTPWRPPAGCCIRAAARCWRSALDGDGAAGRAVRARWSWASACPPRAARLPRSRRASRCSRRPRASSIACSGSTAAERRWQSPASLATTGRCVSRPTTSRPRSRCSSRCCAPWTCTCCGTDRARRCRSRSGSRRTRTRCGLPTGARCSSARSATARRGSSRGRSGERARPKRRCLVRLRRGLRQRRALGVVARRRHPVLRDVRLRAQHRRLPCSRRPREPAAAVATGFNESAARLSPDGRWVAYVTDESGQEDVYVSGWPQGPRARVSQAGGSHPRWSGTSLYFLRGDEVLRASRQPGATPVFDVPQRVLTLPAFGTSTSRTPATACSSSFRPRALAHRTSAHWSTGKPRS